MDEDMEYTPEVWQRCDICGCLYKDEFDPVCSDSTCQQIRWDGINRTLAVQYAEKILDDAWLDSWGL